MKLDEQEIVDLVGETEKRNSDWREIADEMESAWNGFRYEDDRQTKQDLDGVDTVVSPDMFNVIQVLHRMVADELRLEVPSLSPKEDDEDRSELMEEFGVAYENKNNAEQGLNLIHAKVWQSGVLGMGASQVLWMEPLLQKQKLAGRRLPISKRKLDPRQCGEGRGTMGVDFAFHKYEASRAYIRDNYPEYTFKDEPKPDDAKSYWKDKKPIIDFWPRDKGSILHQVVIDGKMAKDEKTDYPDIPIVMWRADGAPVEDERGRSIGILKPIHELWKMKCDIMSKVATGMMYHYDPLMIVKGNFTDQEWAALGALGPGQKVNLHGDQTIEPFSPAPNVPMAQALLQMIQTGIDQATFPGVTYGDAPGGVNAGYAINNLSQQARARANIIRSNIEAAMEYEFYLLFAMIEEFMPDEGMTIYGRSSQGDRGRPLKLSKKDIKGNYECKVMLIPEQPMADAAQISSYINLNDKGIVSKTWVRNRGVNVPVPRDEEVRVAAEQAIASDPDLQAKAAMRAIQQTRKQEDWELFFVGTKYEQLYQQEQQWREQKAHEAEQAKQQRAEERRQKQMQEMMAKMPPPPFAPQGQTMMPTGMPPMQGGISPQGAPGLPPSLPTSGPMPLGMPPQEPPSMPPGAGITPELLGLNPENGAPPGSFQQATGQPPLSDDEMQRRLGIPLPPQ